MKPDERQRQVMARHGLLAAHISWFGMFALFFLHQFLGVPLMTDYLDVGLVLVLSLGYFLVANARAGVKFSLVGTDADGRPRWWWYVLYAIGFLVLDAITGEIEGPGDVIGRILFTIVFLRLVDWALGVLYQHWEHEVAGEDQPGKDVS